MAAPEETAIGKFSAPNSSVIEVIRRSRSEQYFEAVRGTFSALRRAAKPR